MKYTGEKCYGCGEIFSSDDDIVVCPECGTPYHRHCYLEAGKCLNDALHESGGTWQSSDAPCVQNNGEKAEAPGVEYKICPRCFTRNDPSQTECIKCGFVLPDDKESNEAAQRMADYADSMEKLDINKQYLGFNPEESFGDGVNLGEVAQFVSTNTLYYMPIFKRMKDLGTKISFNIICLFCPYFYFANRKMWLWAIITALVSVFLNLPDTIYAIGVTAVDMPFLQGAAKLVSANEDFIKTMMELCSAADWIFRLAACLFGNWLYYRYAVRSVRKEKLRFGGPVSPQRLGTKGGVAPLNVVLTAVILIAMSAALMFATMFIFVYLQQLGII